MGAINESASEITSSDQDTYCSFENSRNQVCFLHVRVACAIYPNLRILLHQRPEFYYKQRNLRISINFFAAGETVSSGSGARFRDVSSSGMAPPLPAVILFASCTQKAQRLVKYNA